MRRKAGDCKYSSVMGIIVSTGMGELLSPYGWCADLLPGKINFVFVLLRHFDLDGNVTGNFYFVQIALFYFRSIGVAELQHDQLLSNERVQIFFRSLVVWRGVSR